MQASTHSFDREIDTRGLNCPLPILRAKKALAEMTSGQVLRVVATDPGSMRDSRPLRGRPATSCSARRRPARNSTTT